MTRCDHDTIFQRVFCVTLVVIAFTFTVILTNVFVDIDGLLTKKAEENTYNEEPEPVLERENDHVKIVRMPNIERPEVYFKELQNYDEVKDADYRSKRSLASQTFLHNVQNPRVKRILSNRLATLLEELDEEESTNIKKNEEDSRKSFDEQKDLEVHEIPEYVNIIDKPNQNNRISPLLATNKQGDDHLNTEVENSRRGNKNEDEMLHLAIHNILLQGIIGHMDLNDVYKKVHQLVQNFDKVDGETFHKGIYKLSDFKQPRKHIPKTIDGFSPGENKFFEEVVKSDKSQSDIADSKRNTAEENNLGRNLEKGPQVSIKTIIDITSNKKAQNRATVDSKENIKGIVKLIYNGKTIKFTRTADDDDSEANKKSNAIRKQMKNPKHIITSTDAAVKEKDSEINEALDMILQKSDKSQNKNSLFSKIVDNYFDRYPNQAVDLDIPDVDEVKRAKREIKIKYEDNEISTSSKKDEKEKEDDELYVEIRTHFDSKGWKGKRKAKIIRNIIDKKSKLIRSDLGVTGIKGLVKKYNSNYEETSKKVPTEQVITSSEEQFHKLSKREVFTKNTHKHVMARSVKDMLVKDYYSNNYEIFFSNDYLHPREIYEGKKLNTDFNSKETENMKNHNAKNMLRVREATVAQSDTVTHSCYC